MRGSIWCAKVGEYFLLPEVGQVSIHFFVSGSNRASEKDVEGPVALSSAASFGCCVEGRGVFCSSLLSSFLSIDPHFNRDGGEGVRLWIDLRPNCGGWRNV